MKHRLPVILVGLSLLSVLAISSFSSGASGQIPREQRVEPAAISIHIPKDIKWTGSGGSQTAVLVGDPAKAGLYVVLTKWLPHNMSRPHFHPNDRYITVISGTWWVGTGKTYDPDSTTPVPAGSFVTHFAKGIHYDGAKDEEVVLEIVGMGPATATQVPVD